MSLTAAHLSWRREAFERQITGAEDIAEIIGHRQLDALSTQRFSFWFTPSLHPSQRPNALATELLLAAGPFTAPTVPVLGGHVVLTAHDHSGCFGSLTAADIQHLASTAAAVRGYRRHLLEGRLRRAERQRLHRIKAQHQRPAATPS